MKVLKWVAVFWFSWAAIAGAQAPEQGIIVTGEGRVSQAPDMATITLGVTESGASASDVMDRVAEAVAAILLELENSGVAPRDLQTSDFFLHPVHDNRASSGDGPPEITGYRAGNTVTVRVRDLAQLGLMMDAVIDTGANNFSGLRFGLQETSEPLAAARALAVADAMARAEHLAGAAGLKLGTVLRMTEESHHGGPVQMEMAAVRPAMGDAIASGEVDMVARVTMVFAIAPGLQ